MEQTTGGDTVGAFSFNCIRSLIGGIVLIPVIHVLDTKTDKKPKTAAEKKTLLTGGIACGCVMFVASSFQQLGISLGTEAGKAGFLTACYILLVPILGLSPEKEMRLEYLGRCRTDPGRAVPALHERHDRIFPALFRRTCDHLRRVLFSAYFAGRSFFTTCRWCALILHPVYHLRTDPD